MPCYHVKLPGGFAAIACGRGRGMPKPCAACGGASGFQCDWKTAPGKTCDAHICAEHALQVATDKHLCPTHQAAYRAWLRQRGQSELPHQEENS